MAWRTQEQIKRDRDQDRRAVMEASAYWDGGVANAWTATTARTPTTVNEHHDSIAPGGV